MVKPRELSAVETEIFSTQDPLVVTQPTQAWRFSARTQDSSVESKAMGLSTSSVTPLTGILAYLVRMTGASSLRCSKNRLMRPRVVSGFTRSSAVLAVETRHVPMTQLFVSRLKELRSSYACRQGMENEVYFEELLGLQEMTLLTRRGVVALGVGVVEAQDADDGLGVRRGEGGLVALRARARDEHDRGVVIELRERRHLPGEDVVAEVLGLEEGGVAGGRAGLVRNDRALPVH